MYLVLEMEASVRLNRLAVIARMSLALEILMIKPSLIILYQLN